MSAPLYCTRCGSANVAGARLCIGCGSPMSMVGPPQAPIAPAPGTGPVFQQPPPYNYAAYAAQMAAQNRVREIDRTKTGLLLLIIGILLGPIPYVVYVGGILVIIGAILVILGRKAFGPIHSRNTIWSVVIYIIGIGIVIAGSVAFIFAVVSASVANAAGTSLSQATVSQSLSSSFNILLVAAAIGGAVLGIAQVLFTYALQNQTGKTLLWIGYAASLAISIIEFIIISPLISSAASQSYANGTYNPVPFSNLQSQLQIIGLLGFIPAIVFASAIYLARSRINTGEIPSSVSQPTTMSTP